MKVSIKAPLPNTQLELQVTSELLLASALKAISQLDEIQFAADRSMLLPQIVQLGCQKSSGNLAPLRRHVQTLCFSVIDMKPYRESDPTGLRSIRTMAIHFGMNPNNTLFLIYWPKIFIGALKAQRSDAFDSIYCARTITEFLLVERGKKKT